MEIRDKKDAIITQRPGDAAAMEEGNEADTNNVSQEIPFHKHCQRTILSALGHQGDTLAQNLFDDAEAELLNLTVDWKDEFTGNDTLTQDLLGVLKVVDKTLGQFTASGGTANVHPFTLSFYDCKNRQITSSTIDLSQDVSQYKMKNFGREVELSIDGARLSFNTMMEDASYDVLSINLPKNPLTFMVNGKNCGTINVPMEDECVVAITTQDENLKISQTSVFQGQIIVSPNTPIYYVDASEDFNPDINLENYGDLEENFIQFQLHVKNVAASPITVKTARSNGFFSPWERIQILPGQVSVIEFNVDMERKLMTMHALWNYRTEDSEMPYLNYDTNVSSSTYRYVIGVNDSSQVESDLEDKYQFGVKAQVFKNYTVLEEVYTPNASYIGDYAYQGCTNLKKIVVSPNVKYIGQSAFDGCTSLTSVFDANDMAIVRASATPMDQRDIASVLTISKYAFRNCTRVSALTLPLRTNLIGTGAFQGCSGLKRVELDPYFDLTIEANAFNGCTGLETLVVGSAVKTIANNTVFAGCTSLNNLTAPARFFYSQSNFRNAFPTYAGISNVEVRNDGQTTQFTYQVFNGCANLQNVVIPTDVVKVSAGLFTNCPSLSCVTTPAVSIGTTNYSQFGNLFQTTTASLTGAAASTHYKAGNYVIPNSLETVVVTAGATMFTFEGMSGLKRVAIANGPSIVPDNTFNKCNNLESVLLPNGVSSIGNSAFAECSSLTDIMIPDSVETIGASAFAGCSSISMLDIPQNVTAIGSYAFEGCSQMKQISLPANVQSIGAGAFHDCITMSNVNIPPNVSAIEDETFYNCRALQGIELNNVSSIGSSAFAGCNGLHEIVVPDNVVQMGADAFKTCVNLTGVHIGSGMTSIGSCAFAECSSINEVTIPQCVLDMGVSTVFPDSFATISRAAFATGVNEISSNAFKDCACLESVAVPEGTTSIGDSAFEGCTSLVSASIPESVVQIGDLAFNGCSSLNSVEIPPYATDIGTSAFGGCSSIEELTIPFSVQRIGVDAFLNCSCLSRLNFRGRSLEQVWQLDNYNWGIDTSKVVIHVDTHVTYIQDSGLPDATFQISGELTQSSISDVYYVKEVALEEGSITSIGPRAFQNCTGLTKINIPSSVTSIGSQAFAGCSSLESITIPNTVEGIGQYAFEDCTSLVNVIFQGRTAEVVQQMENFSTWGLSLGQFIAMEDGKVLYRTTTDGIWNLSDAQVSQDGLFTGFAQAGQAVEVVVPSKDVDSNAIVGIGENAFKDCVNLAKVVVQGGVKSIGPSAFNGCTSLSSVSIPDSLIRIEDGAFAGCRNLATIAIPGGVEFIGQSAFKDCVMLEELDLPRCDGLVIGNQAFSGCYGLTSATIPSGLGNIPDEAFSYCTNLVDLTVSNGVSTIGSNAFKSCSKLKNVTIGEGITSISSDAFVGCVELESVLFVGLKIDEILEIPNYPWSIGDRTTIHGTIASENTRIIYNSLVPREELRNWQSELTASDVGVLTTTQLNDIHHIEFGTAILSIGEQALGSIVGVQSLKFNQFDSHTVVENGEYWGIRNGTKLMFGGQEPIVYETPSEHPALRYDGYKVVGLKEGPPNIFDNEAEEWIFSSETADLYDKYARRIDDLSFDTGSEQHNLKTVSFPTVTYVG